VTTQTTPPERVRLRRGFVAVRRSTEHLQVGVDPPRRAIVPDLPEIRRLLTELEDGTRQRPTTRVACDAWAALEAADLLESVAVPATRPVRIDAPASVADLLAPLIAHAGAQVVDGEADLVVVASEGPAPRERLDALVRDGRAHLVVSGAPDHAVVGPFVLPGRSACVRCVDAHLAIRDTRRGIVVEQMTRLAARAVTDPLLYPVALGLAARDVRAFLRNERPATWSATIRVDGDACERTPWLRHPHCGCAWDALSRGA
jgi:hypothetical protein